MKSFKLIVVIVFLGVVFSLSGDTTLAQPLNQVQNGVDSISSGESPAAGSVIKTIVDTFLYLIGAIAIIMLVYGGFRYVTSSGDTTAVAAAKNTILYALVGLVVAILAFAISSFVVGTFSSSGRQPGMDELEKRDRFEDFESNFQGGTPGARQLDQRDSFENMEDN